MNHIAACDSDPRYLAACGDPRYITRCVSCIGSQVLVTELGVLCGGQRALSGQFVVCNEAGPFIKFVSASGTWARYRMHVGLLPQGTTGPASPFVVCLGNNPALNPCGTNPFEHSMWVRANDNASEWIFRWHGSLGAACTMIPQSPLTPLDIPVSTVGGTTIRTVNGLNGTYHRHPCFTEANETWGGWRYRDFVLGRVQGWQNRTLRITMSGTMNATPRRVGFFANDMSGPAVVAIEPTQYYIPPATTFTNVNVDLPVEDVDSIIGMRIEGGAEQGLADWSTAVGGSQWTTRLSVTISANRFL